MYFYACFYVRDYAFECKIDLNKWTKHILAFVNLI